MKMRRRCRSWPFFPTIPWTGTAPSSTNSVALHLVSICDKIRHYSIFHFLKIFFKIQFLFSGITQVMLSKTVDDPKKLKSVATKVAMQIIAKIGGLLWKLKVCRIFHFFPFFSSFFSLFFPLFFLIFFPFFSSFFPHFFLVFFFVFFFTFFLHFFSLFFPHFFPIFSSFFRVKFQFILLFFSGWK